MPVTYRITGKIAWIICDTEFVYQEFTSAIEEAMADPEFSPQHNFLFDYRCYEGNTPQDLIQARANYLGRLQGKISSAIAILVADPAHFGLGRMLQLYTDRYGFEINVYYEEGDALSFFERQTIIN
jgi:hypothetical protein